MYNLQGMSISPLKGCISKNGCDHFGNNGRGTIIPENIITIDGKSLLIPSPDIVQKRLIITIVVMAEDNKAANIIDAKKAIAAFHDTGDEKSKNNPTIKNSGIERMIVGTIRIAIALKNQSQ